jgi:hypothetical protein
LNARWWRGRGCWTRRLLFSSMKTSARHTLNRAFGEKYCCLQDLQEIKHWQIWLPSKPLELGRRLRPKVVNGVVACISAVLIAGSLGGPLKVTTISEPTPEEARNAGIKPNLANGLGWPVHYRRRFNAIHERRQTDLS